MAVYCQKSDVYRFVPPGVLQVPGRLVASISTSTEIVTLAGHGLADDQPILFRAESGGSLPAELVSGTTYYAKPLTEDTFQVRAVAGGSPINLSTSGSNVVLITPFLWDEWIEEVSRSLDQTVTAHKVPLLNPDSSVPEPIRTYAAALLTIRALAHVGADTGAIQKQLEFFSKQADKWGRGVPLRGEQVPTSTAAAIVRSGSRVDPRGWDRGTGRIP